jgi:hypothetical protein
MVCAVDRLPTYQHAVLTRFFGARKGDPTTRITAATIKPGKAMAQEHDKRRTEPTPKQGQGIKSKPATMTSGKGKMMGRWPTRKLRRRRQSCPP